MRIIWKSKLTQCLIICAIWYIALFPGRLGFDSAEAIRMVQRGESTDWWSALFFWFIKIFSFQGKTIAVASLIQISILFYSCREFVFSLPFDLEVRQKTLKIFVATPFFGFFALGISHDVFLAAGVLLLLSLEFRNVYQLNLQHYQKQDSLKRLIIIISMSMSKIGLLLLIIYFVTSLFRREISSAVIIASSSVLIFLISSIGITQQASGLYLWPAIADLKCIAQHDEAEISPDQWKWLDQLAPEHKWKEPVSCASMDLAVQSLGLEPNISIPLSSRFITNYFEIAIHNPLIATMAHINRSRVALPPPFFPIPANQVNLDLNTPIGQGTNIALQTGPELLHPSIDEPTMKVEKGPLKILEMIVQVPTFLINQASWFWGWGGLWLWVIGFSFVLKLTPFSIRRSLVAIWPIFWLHLVLTLLAPNSLPRYVMSTVYCGIIITISLLISIIHKRDNSVSEVESAN